MSRTSTYKIEENEYQPTATTTFELDSEQTGSVPSNAPAPRMLEMAQQYAGHGWHVFPLQSNGKVPLGGSGFKQATIDAEKVTEWWTSNPTANIGVSLDPSGLCVIDVDKHGDVDGFDSLHLLGDMPGTFKANTPSGGAHYVFSNNGTPPPRKVGLVEGIDLLANGYIVAAPSVINGRAYQWESGQSKKQLASFPQSVRDMAAPAPAQQAVNTTATGATAGTKQDRSRIMHRASLWLEQVEAAYQGQAGHSKLLWAAQGLANGFKLGRGDALSLLWSEYNPRCVPQWDQGNAGQVKDLERKVDQALANPVKTPGWLIGDDKPYVADQHILDFVEDMAARLKAEQAAEAQAIEATRAHVNAEAAEQQQSDEDWQKKPEYFSEGALSAIWDDIHERSNPRNVALTSGATYSVMSAMIGQHHRLLPSVHDKRANSQVVMLAASGAGKDAPFRYYTNVIREIYGRKCFVGTYDSPTVVQMPLRDTGYCFEARDEAGDLLQAINSNTNPAGKRIGAMLKTLKSSAASTYDGFDQSKLKDNPLSFHCIHPFYSSLQIATPGAFMNATGDCDIEGGYWGRVLLFNIEKRAEEIHPSLCKRFDLPFSYEVNKLVQHFKSMTADRRSQWEDKDVEYSTVSTPDTVILQEAATNYIYQESKAYREAESTRSDYYRIEPIAHRLAELTYELLLVRVVSKFAMQYDKAMTATLDDARLCWEYALKLHKQKLKLLRLQMESIEEKIEKHVINSCEQKADRTMKKGALKTYISHNYRGRIKPHEMIEHLSESGKFKFLPNKDKPLLIVLNRTE